MRASVLVGIVVAGCWSGKAGNEPPAPPPPAPAPRIPRTGDEFVHRVFDALDKHDAHALVELTKITAPSLACAPKDARELSPERIEAVEGLVQSAATMHAEMRVLGFKDQSTAMIVRAHGGPSCDNIPVTNHDLTVDLQLRLDGHDRRFPVRAMLYAEVVDGEWFLAVQPVVPLRSAAARDRELAPLSARVVAACTCRDAACFATASQGYHAAINRLADEIADPNEEPDKTLGEAERAEWDALDARLAKCGEPWAIGSGSP
jgi:hypothetical protein